MSERKCCYLDGGKTDGTPCSADAEWVIYSYNAPREPIDACTKHVGYLLDDSPETLVLPAYYVRPGLGK